MPSRNDHFRISCALVVGLELVAKKRAEMHAQKSPEVSGECVEQLFGQRRAPVDAVQRAAGGGIVHILCEPSEYGFALLSGLSVELMLRAYVAQRGNAAVERPARVGN